MSPRIAAACWAALVCAPLGGCAPSAGPELRVAVLLPLTGREAPYADSFKKGLVLAMAEELDRPGSGGAPFELRYRDVGADAQDGARAIRELVSGGNTPAAIAVSSDATLAAAAAANQTRTILLSALGTAPEISLLGDWVYRTGTSDLQDGIAMAQYCVGRFSRVAILYPDTAQGQGLSQIVR